MKKIYKKKSDPVPTADEIADMADKGGSVSKFFTNKGKMKFPVQRVNIDFTTSMLQEIDNFVSELNISRQAFIKTCLRQNIDQHYLAKKAS